MNKDIEIVTISINQWGLITIYQLIHKTDTEYIYFPFPHRPVPKKDHLLRPKTISGHFKIFQKAQIIFSRDQKTLN